MFGGGGDPSGGSSNANFMLQKDCLRHRHVVSFGLRGTVSLLVSWLIKTGPGKIPKIKVFYRILFKSWGGGTSDPIVGYMGRLRPKGVSFLSSQYIKG